MDHWQERALRAEAALRARDAEVAELVAANDQLIEMCDQLVSVNNKTLGRGAVRIQSAIIDRFLRKVERSRAALRPFRRSDDKGDAT